MKKTDNKSETSILRQKAEGLLKKRPSRTSPQFSESDVLKLVHELEVHQIEMEMQNDELRLAKEREAELATEKFVELYDFAPSGYFTLSREGKIIELNLSGAKMLGKDRSRLKNNSFGLFVSRDTRSDFNLFLAKVFSSQTQETCEVALTVAGDSPTYVHLSGIVNQNGEHCFVSMVDITEIRKLADLNEILLSSLPHPAMYVRSKDRVVLAVNKIAADLGVKVGGYCWRDFGNEEHLSPKEKEISAKYPELVPAEFNIKCSFCLGDKCFTDSIEQNNPEVHSFGLIWDTYWIKISNDIFLHYAIDITERKKMEEALRKSEEHNKALLNANPDMMFVLDQNGVFVDFHSRNESYLYTSSVYFIGKNILEVLPADVAKITNYQLKQVFQTGQIQVFTYQLKVKRKFRDFESRLVLCGDSLALAIVRDITERKQMEEKLIIAKEKAVESDRLKSAFLANMSHEIRTPMSGILGFAELLKRPGLSSEQQKKYINIIEQSGGRMLNIINDIIDISKIESGQMKVSISRTNINEQIEYIYSFFKDEIEQKGMRIFFKNSLPEEKAIIRTDREKFYAILTNLVKNAIKYSEKGTIEFGYVSTSSTTGQAETVSEPVELQFYVKDSGIGIPEDRQEAIFNRFIQADVDDRKAQQGAGLGLAITKAFVEMLGGKIWVKSISGKGSEFYFTLPYNPGPEEQKVSRKIVPTDMYDMEPVNKLKILVAEDDEFSEMLITIALERFYSEVQIVKTGFEAVEACRNNPDLDLILMDIKMPGMNGYEAIRQIRKFNKDVVIVVQTAYGQVRDREKAMETGCDDYISKPYSIGSLTSLIKKYFSQHAVT